MVTTPSSKKAVLQSMLIIRATISSGAAILIVMLVIVGSAQAVQQEQNINGTSCKLCQEGAALNEDSDLPFFADSYYFDGNVSVNVRTCGQLEDYVSSSSSSSSIAFCNLSNRFLGDYCQCDGRSIPKHERKCSLCGGAEQQHNIFTNQLYGFRSNRTIINNDFPFPTCQSLAQATEILLTEGSEDCTGLRQRFADYCGCDSSTVTETPCSLCRDGSPISTLQQHREISFLKDQFYGLSPTCELLESSVRSFESTSTECREAQNVGAYCGCPAVENACRFCEVGQIAESKKAKRLWILERDEFGFGAVAPTCEQVEATLSQRPSSSRSCRNIQEYDYLCGCRDGLYGYHGTENEQEQYILALLPRIAGIFSLFGSISIIIDVAYRRLFPSIYHVLMGFMAAFDLITSICWIIGSKAVPRKSPLYLCVVNNGSASVHTSSFVSDTYTPFYYYSIMQHKTNTVRIIPSMASTLVQILRASFKEHWYSLALVSFLCSSVFEQCLPLSVSIDTSNECRTFIKLQAASFTTWR